MENTNFMQACFYNQNCFGIIYSEDMKLLGENSILNKDNYLISKDNKRIFLMDALDSIFVYDNNYVSFIIKETFRDIIDDYEVLRCGYTDFNIIKLVRNKIGYIQDLCISTNLTKKTSPLSLATCSSYSPSKNSIILLNNNSLPYYNLDNMDFYVTTPLGIFKNPKIELIDSNKYSFTFLDNLIESPNDTIILKTITLPSSIDILGDSILGSDMLTVQNNINTEIKNACIISYINNILTILLNFTSDVVRYDSNDFKIYIDNILYSSIGHKSYTKSDYFLTINNIPYLDIENDNILIKTWNKSSSYTIDSRLLPVVDEDGKLCKVFKSINGEVKDNFFDKVLAFTINFNSNPASKYNSTFQSKLSISNNKDILSLLIEDIGTIRFYGINLTLDENNNLNTVSCTTNGNSILLSFPTNIYDFFIINNPNINYIDFTPNTTFVNSDDIQVLISNEAPLFFNKEDLIIISPSDQGEFFSLLGQNVFAPVLIYVDRSLSSRFYGSNLKRTNFIGGLSVRYLDTNNLYDTVSINFINFKISTLSISLPNYFSSNIIHSQIGFLDNF